MRHSPAMTRGGMPTDAVRSRERPRHDLPVRKFHGADSQSQHLPRVERQIGRLRQVEPTLQPRKLVVAQIKPYPFTERQIPKLADTFAQVAEWIRELRRPVGESDQEEFELIGRLLRDGHGSLNEQRAYALAGDVRTWASDSANRARAAAHSRNVFGSFIGRGNA
jgi:hypothetical protein